MQVEEALALNGRVSGSVVRALRDDGRVPLEVPDRCRAQGLVLRVFEQRWISQACRLHGRHGTLATPPEVDTET